MRCRIARIGRVVEALQRKKKGKTKSEAVTVSQRFKSQSSFSQISTRFGISK